MIRNVIIFLLLLGLFGSFASGFYAGRIYGYVVPIERVANIDAGQPEDVDFSLFWDAWRVVQEKYAGTEELDIQGMVYGAIQGMVDSLGDPYTVFLPPDESKRFLEDIAGSFSGVGMEIGIRDGQLRVIAPLEGTPAEAAGLRAGDYIVRIGEDVFTSDIGIDEAVSLIRGPEGSVVTLAILREGWDEAKEFTIERGVINIPSMTWEFRDDDVVHIRLFQFSEIARHDFQKVANEILASSTDKIILDVRNNPGGFLEVAVDIAGYFLERGEVVVIEDKGGTQDEKEYKARGNSRLKDFSIVVLINEGSASASEILAGALRDQRGAQLIGAKSFGKGSVQELEEFKDASSLKVTIANWLTPNGNLITGVGLEPDIAVPVTDEDREAGVDPQVQKAIEVLKDL
jgi:carboxyl-terminal processing protease